MAEEPTVYREHEAWLILKRRQLADERAVREKETAAQPVEKKLSQAEINKIVSEFKAAHPERENKMLIPGTGHTDQDPYNAKKCPVCGSDRRSTALQVNMLDPSGNFVGKAACRNSWHQPKQSDARLGFGKSTPSENRAVGRGDAVKSGM